MVTLYNNGGGKRGRNYTAYKNDQLAENMIALIKKIKDIEIFEEKKMSKKRKKSKIDEILENPYDIKDFKIYPREEIYERAGIH